MSLSVVFVGFFAIKWGNTQKAIYHLEQAGKKADFLHDKKRYESKLNALHSLTAKL